MTGSQKKGCYLTNPFQVEMIQQKTTQANQKIAAKAITKADLDKYEALVDQFVKKFGNKELSEWEIGLWLRKVARTRNDALDAPFDEHMFNDDLSDVSSQELSPAIIDQNESMSHEEFEEIKVEVDSVQEFFENQKALETLLENLPSVPNSEDEELEERLRILKSLDEPDETKEGGREVLSNLVDNDPKLLVRHWPGISLEKTNSVSFGGGNAQECQEPGARTPIGASGI